MLIRPTAFRFLLSFWAPTIACGLCACSESDSGASQTAEATNGGSGVTATTATSGASSGNAAAATATNGVSGAATGTGTTTGGGPSTTSGSATATGAASTTGGVTSTVGGNGGAGGGGGQTATLTSSSTGGTPSTDGTSAELLEAIALGWNLGNSLDAPEGETAWGNPEVSASLLQAVKAAGFGLVRIPVTWSLSIGPSPDYTIDPARLARVSEVVGYAQSAGLVAIINLHHDGADEYDGVEWITLNDAAGNITEANNTAVRDQFERVWIQIADYFKDHDHGLLFESLNEIHDGYDAPDPAYHDIINDLNQAFVDIVRASGGNNPTRHLVVPGYNTNIDYTLEGWEVPSDPTSDHLILSVHYYDPWDYAGAAATNTWGASSPGSDTWGQEDHVVAQFDRLKASYVDQGIPVIIGEYGAVQQNGFEDYRRYYMEYVTKAARDRGILPVYWDNGGPGSGEDAFGLFDRTSEQVLHADVLAAMLRAATEDYSLDAVALPTP